MQLRILGEILGHMVLW